VSAPGETEADSASGRPALDRPLANETIGLIEERQFARRSCSLSVGDCDAGRCLPTGPRGEGLRIHAGRSVPGLEPTPGTVLERRSNDPTDERSTQATPSALLRILTDRRRPGQRRVPAGPRRYLTTIAPWQISDGSGL
jgi:hypothetical protein